MSYGEKITQLRKKNGMTQAELGAKLNVTYQAVSKWERGESEPDFATMSKMARIFGVGLSYFEESDEPSGGIASGAVEPAPEKADETSDRAVKTEPPKTEKKIAGMCTSCGKVIYEGEGKIYGGKLVCAACDAKARAAAEATAKRNAAAYSAYAEELCVVRRRGFIWGTVAAVVFLVIAIIAIVISENKAAAAAGWLIVSALSFFTVSQLFWDGIVAEIATIGGKVVGTPGVIFTFDLDGFIFLIAMKVLFAIIRMLIYVITFMFFVVVAAVISPFTFGPCLKRVNGEIEGRRTGAIRRPDGFGGRGRRLG